MRTIIPKENVVMKNKWIAFFLAFFLILPFASQAVAGEAEIILKTVSTFYKGYITSLDTSDETYRWQEQPEVDPSFVRKLDALIEKATKEEGGLGYDPLLMAQDWPREDMEYVTPVIKGTTAEMIAYTVWGDSKQPLCVTLANKKGVWRITDVIDMIWYDGEEKLECGGLKRAPKGQ